MRRDDRATLELKQSLVAAPDQQTRDLIMSTAVGLGATTLSAWSWWMYRPVGRGMEFEHKNAWSRRRQRERDTE